MRCEVPNTSDVEPSRRWITKRVNAVVTGISNDKLQLVVDPIPRVSSDRWIIKSFRSSRELIIQLASLRYSYIYIYIHREKPGSEWFSRFADRLTRLRCTLTLRSWLTEFRQKAENFPWYMRLNKFRCLLVRTNDDTLRSSTSYREFIFPCKYLLNIAIR